MRILWDWDRNSSIMSFSLARTQAKCDATFYLTYKFSVLLEAGTKNLTGKYKIEEVFSLCYPLQARLHLLYLLDMEGAQSIDLSAHTHPFPFACEFHFETTEIENYFNSSLRDYITFGLIFLIKLQLEIYMCTLLCIFCTFCDWFIKYSCQLPPPPPNKKNLMTTLLLIQIL